MMLSNPLPPLDVLRQNYRYDPHSGVLEARNYTYNKHLKKQVPTDNWRVVKCVSDGGYIVTECNGKQLKAHRICWALHHGEDPYPLEIDHKNRKRNDNTIRNLRKATPSENSKNKDNPNRHKQRPVKITYPDGRGVIVTDSIKTAAAILNSTYTRIQQHLKRGNTNPLRWQHEGKRYSSGIRVAYA
jgi:hypothetical protein